MKYLTKMEDQQIYNKLVTLFLSSLRLEERTTIMIMLQLPEEDPALVETTLNQHTDFIYRRISTYYDKSIRGWFYIEPGHNTYILIDCDNRLNVFWWLVDEIDNDCFVRGYTIQQHIEHSHLLPYCKLDLEVTPSFVTMGDKTRRKVLEMMLDVGRILKEDSTAICLIVTWDEMVRDYVLGLQATYPDAVLEIFHGSRCYKRIKAYL